MLPPKSKLYEKEKHLEHSYFLINQLLTVSKIYFCKLFFKKIYIKKLIQIDPPFRIITSKVLAKLLAEISLTADN